MATIFPTGLTYSRNGKDPLVDKVIWSSLADAQAYVDNVNETAYVGMTLSVIGDGVLANNGFWYVESIGTGKDEAYKAGSLKKIGSSEAINATDYSDALLKAQTLPVGTIIKVLDAEGSVESSDFHAAGFYIVSVSGENAVILYLSTTTGEDMDLEQVISQLTALTAEVNKKADSEALNNYYTKTESDSKFVNDVKVNGTSVVSDGVANIDISGKVNVSDYNTYKQDVQDALDSKLVASDLDAYAKSADVVALSDYNTKMDELDASIATKASQDDVDALSGKVGNAADGEAAATGLYKLIADTDSALRSIISEIPKFAITVVNELPATGDSATVYLVLDKADNTGDLYTEYIYVNGAWENLGKQTVDFTAYSTTIEMNTAIADAIATVYSKDEVYTKTEVDGKIDDLANTYETIANVESALSEAKTTLTAEINKKANAADVYTTTDIDNKLATKADTSALDAYVLTSNLETYKGTVTAALETKADASALDAYVTIASLDTKVGELGYAKSDVLSGYVTTNTFNSTLAKYATTAFVTDGLATKLDVSVFNTTIADYVTKTAINDSTSVALVDGIVEVNTIDDSDLATLGIVKK